MTSVAWREDDFEEGGIDPRMFPSGGANTWIIEKELFWNPEGDLIYSGPTGRIEIVNGIFDPKWNACPNLLRTPIVLSRSSIDEPSRQVEANSSVSSWEDSEEILTAIHPVTKPVYDQLSSIPENYRQSIRVLLTQFASSLPKDESAKLPHLRLAALEDSSYLLEWTFKDRRLGFSFETNPKESGWYYVFSSDSSERYESGTMDQLEMSRLIEMTLRP